MTTCLLAFIALQSPTPSFTQVVIDGPMTVEIKRAERHRVNTTPGVKAVNSGGVLRLSLDDPSHREHRASLDLASLSTLKMRGAGMVNVKGLRPTSFLAMIDGSSIVTIEGTAEKAAANVTGSATLTWRGLASNSLRVVAKGAVSTTFAGATDQLNLTVEGPARVDASSLRAEAVIVAHRGSNKVNLRSAGTVSGVITGPGDLVVTGNPKIDVGRSGVGRVVKDNSAN